MANRSYIALLLLVFSSLAYTACRKEVNRPIWEVDVAIPLAKSTINASQLISDSLVQVDADGNIFFSLSDTIYEVSPDSLVSIPDTEITAYFVIPDLEELLPGFTDTALKILPDSIFSLPVPLDLSYDLPGGAELTEMFTNSGYLDYVASNTIEQQTIVYYTIPNATKDGEALTIKSVSEGGSKNNPITIAGTVDLSNYWFDLTAGDTTQFNTIQNTISIQGGKDTTYIASGDSVFVSMKFRDFQTQSVYGYFGQNDLDEITDTVAFGGFSTDFFSAGKLAVDQVDLHLKIINEVGADMGGILHELGAKNTTTGETVLLTHDSLGQLLRVNRAPDSLNASSYTLAIEDNNSNITDLFNLQPNRLFFEMEVKTNPDGNVLNHGDFHHQSSAVRLISEVNVPLRIQAENITLHDTIDFASSLTPEQLTNFEGKLRINVWNNFPVGADLKVTLLGEDSVALVPLITSPAYVSSGQVSVDYSQTDPVLSTLYIDVNDAVKEALPYAAYASIEATISTADFPEFITLTDDQYLDIKIIALAETTIAKK